MNNIKKIIIVVFSVFFFISTVHATVLDNQYSNNNKIHMLTAKNQKCAYILKIDNFDYVNHNNLLNLILYGTLHSDSNTMSYFTLGYNYHQKNLKFQYQDLNIQPVNPMIIGFYMKKIGTIEYGQDYNLMYDMNHFIHKNFYNDFDFQKLSQDNTYNLKSSMTYRNTNFFGLIENLTIALQYQYPNCDIYNNWYKSILSHFIRYDCKKFGISIAGMYAADINHYINSQFSKNVDYKKEKYGLAFKYHFHNLHFASLYSKSIDVHVDTYNKDILFKNHQNINIFLSYYFTHRICFSIGCLQKFSFQKTYYNVDLIKTIKKDHHINFLNYYNKLTLSLEYLYNKNIFLYFNDKIDLLENKNINLLNLTHIKNLFQMGVVYFF
ncbi:porin [Buchnera aphidicola]|uniref:porin n=1 Tax=Buchnera aphidicola TaxID=9 RepID=UPI0034643CD8